MYVFINPIQNICMCVVTEKILFTREDQGSKTSVWAIDLLVKIKQFT